MKLALQLRSLGALSLLIALGACGESSVNEVKQWMEATANVSGAPPKIKIKKSASLTIVRMRIKVPLCVKRHH